MLVGVMMISCGELAIDHNTSTSGSKAILASGATIDTPSTLELSSGLLQLKSSGTGSWGCGYNAAGSNSGTESTTYTTQTATSDLNTYQANLFTPTVYMKVSSLQIRIRKVGGPTGNMVAQFRTTSGSDPTSTVLGTSTDVLISSIPNTAPTGHLITFSFSTAVELTSGTTYALVLKPQSDATLDGANYFGWMSTNSTGPDGCTDFPIFRSTSNGGAAWGAGNNATYRRSFFFLLPETHSTPGTASWIVSGYANAIWNMSTFAMSENPSGATTGTIVYDVGAGDNAVTASYSQTNLTKAQVLGLSNLTGQYFYLKATMSVSNSFNQAVLGNGSITAQ